MTKRYVVTDEDTIDPDSLDLDLGPIYDDTVVLPVSGYGGLLTPYLNGLGESVTWKSRSSVDEYNQPIYVDSTIAVIWFDDQKYIRNSQGEDLMQLAYIQTKAAIEEGDQITRGGLTWPIIGVQKTPTFAGEQFRIGNLGSRMI